MSRIGSRTPAVNGAWTLPVPPGKAADSDLTPDVLPQVWPCAFAPICPRGSPNAVRSRAAAEAAKAVKPRSNSEILGVMGDRVDTPSERVGALPNLRGCVRHRTDTTGACAYRRQNSP